MKEEGTLAFAAGRISEAAWLIAVLAVPIFFNVYTERVFEADKAILLRSLAAIALGGLVVHRAAGGRAVTGLWRSPLVVALAALAVSIAVSTALSIAPGASFWGSYIRQQGVTTWLAHLAIFAAVVSLARRSSAERLFDAILLASTAAALYAIVQSVGADPIRWTETSGAPRAHGTAGNPIFLGAFLILAMPLTWSRAVGALTAALPARRRAIAAAAYLILLCTQALALLYTQSRGPLLGLAAGATIFVLTIGALRDRRALLATLASLCITAAACLTFWFTPATRIEARRSDGLVETRSARQLIWNGTARLIASDGLRAVIGYGPETLFFTFPRFYPSQLAHTERSNTSPDRAHNEIFDALATVGILGCLAEVGLFALVFATALGGLGLLASRRQELLFVVASAAATAATAAIAVALGFGSLAAPAAGGALAASVAVFLAYRLVKPAAAAPSRHTLMFTALLTAAAAHWVEIQVGIATPTTRLLFIAFAALLVALSRSPAVDDGAPSGRRDALSIGVLTGLTLAISAFDLWLPTIAPREHVGAAAFLFGGIWLFGLVRVAVPPADHPAGPRAVGLYSIASFAVMLVFAVLHWRWLVAEPSPTGAPASPRAVGEHLAASVLHIHLVVLGSVVILAGVLRRGRSAPTHPEPLRWGRSAAALLAAWLMIGLVAAVVGDGVEQSRADSYSKLGGIQERKKQRDAAVAGHALASQRRPAEVHYAANLARALMERARRTLGSGAWEADLARAEKLLVTAARQAPLDADHPINLARVYRQWAIWAEPEKRARQEQKAHTAYAGAVELKPNSGDLWNELGTLFLQRGDKKAALSAFDRSIEVDSAHPTTYWLRGELHYDEGRLGEARADYERAIEIDPNQVAAWSALALTQAQLGDDTAAIAANLRVLELQPDDLVSHRNLAVLHSRGGQLDQAIEEAEAALALADGSERRDLADFLADLRRLRPHPEAPEAVK